MICVAAGTLWIDAVTYGPVLRDSQGQPASHSLDGRSFGPTPLVALTVQAVPLWTWWWPSPPLWSPAMSPGRPVATVAHPCGMVSPLGGGRFGERSPLTK